MSATPNNKILTQSNQEVFAELATLLKSHPFSKVTLLQLLLRIQPQENEAAKLSSQIEKILNLILMNVLNVGSSSHQNQQSKTSGGLKEGIIELKEVLKVVFEAQQNKAIKRTLIITFIENILECLGVSDLTEVLSLISEQICNFSSSLQESQQYKLLRIINHLLKRVSKTQDYRIRGQLHFTLTRFLPLAHDSGFNYRSVPAKASQWQRINPTEEQLKDNLGSEVSYEFYEDFWEMQKYYMDLSELQAQDINISPAKGSQQELPISSRLKKIQITLREVENYFKNHLPNQTSSYYSQPLKFLKNFKLLELQLNDPFFRKIIMTQTLIFTFSISNQTGKSTITLSEGDKKTILQIQNIAKNNLIGYGKQGKELLQETQRLFSNELYWVDLKDNWKDRKKTFFRKAQQVAEEQRKHKVIDIQKKREDIRRQINEKMKIDGSSLLNFLENKQSLSIQKAPTTPSFSYFYSQALSCLNSYDKETNKQNEFETRSQYNMFEWKAMRSLYRENIRDMWVVNDKCPPKMKEFRLISLMYRKEEDTPTGQPHKKIKQD